MFTFLSLLLTASTALASQSLSYSTVIITTSELQAMEYVFEINSLCCHSTGALSEKLPQIVPVMFFKVKTDALDYRMGGMSMTMEMPVTTTEVLTYTIGSPDPVPTKATSAGTTPGAASGSMSAMSGISMPSAS